MNTSLAELAGRSLGTHSTSYSERDAQLYALAVGACADDLDLVYERDLRVLPCYALALGLWAVEAAGELGAYDPLTSLHAAQHLVVHQELPAAGTVEMTGRVSEVWDKGKAAMVDVEVSCHWFSATYSIFLPGRGGWGGQRGPSAEATEAPMDWHENVDTSGEQAALYRLTGDRHPVHIDPAVAADYGFARPILHGLCTLGIAARAIAEPAGAHPCSLTELTARFAAPVLPGNTLELSAGSEAGETAFLAAVAGRAVLTHGRARFTPYS